MIYIRARETNRPTKKGEKKMLVDKEDKKLRKKFSDDGYGNRRLCRICKEGITEQDIEENNFEYSKNKENKDREIFIHKTCWKKELKESLKQRRKNNVGKRA